MKYVYTLWKNEVKVESKQQPDYKTSFTDLIKCELNAKSICECGIAALSSFFITRLNFCWMTESTAANFKSPLMLNFGSRSFSYLLVARFNFNNEDYTRLSNNSTTSFCILFLIHIIITKNTAFERIFHPTMYY